MDAVDECRELQQPPDLGSLYYHYGQTGNPDSEYLIVREKCRFRVSTKQPSVGQEFMQHNEITVCNAKPDPKTPSASHRSLILKSVIREWARDGTMGR